MSRVIFKANERGAVDHGWLKAKHYFSFASYYNAKKTNFGALRVLNDDIIQPGEGFGTHPHENMEIITIPLKGALAHKDSTGHQEIINPGEVQVMSAGSGIYHSEFNASQVDLCNLFQIWIFPNKKDIEPRYDQKIFDSTERLNNFQLLVSPDGKDESLWINQDAYISIAALENENEISYSKNILSNGIFLLSIDGEISVDHESLNSRDAIGIVDSETITIQAKSRSEVLLIEVPMEFI